MCRLPASLTPTLSHVKDVETVVGLSVTKSTNADFDIVGPDNRLVFMISDTLPIVKKMGVRALWCHHNREMDFTEDNIEKTPFTCFMAHGKIAFIIKLFQCPNGRVHLEFMLTF